jgi:hypothetical protein
MAVEFYIYLLGLSLENGKVAGVELWVDIQLVIRRSGRASTV